METATGFLRKLTVKRVLYKLQLTFDRFRGLDFLSIIEPEEIGYDPKLVVHSSPSGNKYLVRLLKDLNVTARDSIVDIGSGKGSAMLVMCRFPFARVDGIELSSLIAGIAKKNFATLNKKQCHIFNCDAATYQDFSPYTMLYFYHPFPAEIMRTVITNIEQSFQGGNKEVLIIYNNPVCHQLIVDRGMFFKRREYPDEWGNKIYVYSNMSMEHSRLNHVVSRAG